MIRHVTFSLVALAALLAARAPAADACTLHGDVQNVVYWSWLTPYDLVRDSDMRCTYGAFTSCELHGYYVTPKGVGSSKLPTVVFIQGSGNPGPFYCDVVNAFTDRGFVVFHPFMRGLTGSLDGVHTDFTNTGTYVVDWATAQQQAQGGTLDDWSITGLFDETLDVDAALRFLTTMPNVDSTKLALVGHSYGGALVTLAASKPWLGGSLAKPKVTVSLSGAAMSWDWGNSWETWMRIAASQHQMPMYFQRLINESPMGPDLNSALEPFNAALATGNARLAAYSSYQPTLSIPGCADYDWHAAHCAFVFERAGVAIWIDGVVGFLADYGVK